MRHCMMGQLYCLQNCANCPNSHSLYPVLELRMECNWLIPRCKTPSRPADSVFFLSGMEIVTSFGFRFSCGIDYYEKITEGTISPWTVPLCTIFQSYDIFPECLSEMPKLLKLSVVFTSAKCGYLKVFSQAVTV